MIRVLHFSDVHIEAPLGTVPWRQFASKRFIGLVNLVLLRRRRHREAPEKVEAIGRFMHELDVDLVVCTGDYTALGTEPEIARARHLIQDLTSAPLGFVTVPGNHDVYLTDAVRHRRFERHFGDLLYSDLPDLCADGPWPVVRLPHDDLAVVAVDSARPNPAPWLSSGRVPEAQLEGLRRALRDPRVRGRFVIVATHYAPRLASGRPDHRRHGLDNADALLEACKEMDRGVLMHGHVHHCYHVRVPGLRPPVFGAGSATHEGREGFWLYELEGRGGTATPARWREDRYELELERRVVLFNDRGAGALL